MFFSRATLNEIFTAKDDGVLPRTPQVRPESEIYTPKRDDEHPHPFHMRSPSPGMQVCIPQKWSSFLKRTREKLQALNITEKIIQENAFEHKKKKPGLNLTPG